MISGLVALIASALASLAAVAWLRSAEPAIAPDPLEVRLDGIIDELLHPRFCGFVVGDLVIDRARDAIEVVEHGRVVRVVGWRVQLGTRRPEHVTSPLRMRILLHHHLSEGGGSA